MARFARESISSFLTTPKLLIFWFRNAVAEISADFSFKEPSAFFIEPSMQHSRATRAKLLERNSPLSNVNRSFYPSFPNGRLPFCGSELERDRGERGTNTVELGQAMERDNISSLQPNAILYVRLRRNLL
jgi:hypothetical protein